MGMKEHALAYQKKGFSVIPISPSNKQPMIKFADKPAMTAQEIEDFWSQYPDSNIAVRTDKFFVIDVDLHGKANGYESLANWEHLNLITPTLQAKTASGGKHIFYFKHPDVSMTQMIGFLPGVDIKAHPNNYVLVAPSKTPKGVYTWDKKKSKEGGRWLLLVEHLSWPLRKSTTKRIRVAIWIISTTRSVKVLVRETVPQNYLKWLSWGLVMKVAGMTHWQNL